MPETIDFNTLAKLLPLHVKTNQVPFLAGVPGIGKSATIKKLADQLNTKVFILSVNGISTKEDLTGARMVEDKAAKYGAKQVFFPTAVVQDAVNYANANPDKPVILFLDEINRTTPDVTSAFMSVITERKIGDVELPNNIRLIAAGNDSGNVTQLDTASISRMQVYHVTPDPQSFLKVQPDLNYFIKNLILKHPEFLVQLQDDSVSETNDNNDPDDDDEDSDSASLDELSDYEQMAQITVPRTLTYMSDFLNAIPLDGKSVPNNLDEVYNPIDPQASPLYYAIQATLGNTKTAQALFDSIIDSIDRLNSSNNPTAQDKTVNVPTPNADLLKAMKENVQTHDDVEKLFNDQNFTKEDFTNTFYTLIQPETYQSINYSDATTAYYDFLNDLIANDNGNPINQDSDEIVSIIKKFNELLSNGKVARPIIEYIKKQQKSVLDKRLNFIIEINDF